jgi:endonuclease III
VLDIGLCLTKLEGFYGTVPPPPGEAFLYFVWETLGIRSNPRRRDAAIKAMKRVRALTPDAVARTPQAKIEAAVALAGPNLEARLQALRMGADLFRRAPRLPATLKGPVRAARRSLKPFSSFAPGMPRRMLLFAGEHAVWPRDPGVARLCGRLEPQLSNPSKVERAIARALPRTPTALRHAYVYLSHHAVATCIERQPHCGVCPLLADCTEGQRRMAGEPRIDLLKTSGESHRDRTRASTE